jgi:hypothetical protein
VLILYGEDLKETENIIGKLSKCIQRRKERERVRGVGGGGEKGAIKKGKGK